MEGIHGAGKGDTYRKVDYNEWSKNYDAIFGKKVKKNVKESSASNRSEVGRTNTRKRRSRNK
jgi:hypothetical protein